MSGQENIATLQTIYGAFAHGDVETILARVADDVDWSADADTTVAPWYGRRATKDEVAKFFADVAGSTQVLEFDSKAFAANDDGDVFSIIHFQARDLATGMETSMNLHHYFRFDDGKVSYYRGSEDTAQTARAITG
jgi:uncharacterized protein